MKKVLISCRLPVDLYRAIEAARRGTRTSFIEQALRAVIQTEDPAVIQPVIQPVIQQNSDTKKTAYSMDVGRNPWETDVVVSAAEKTCNTTCDTACETDTVCDTPEITAEWCMARGKELGYPFVEYYKGKFIWKGEAGWRRVSDLNIYDLLSLYFAIKSMSHQTDD